MSCKSRIPYRKDQSKRFPFITSFLRSSGIRAELNKNDVDEGGTAIIKEKTPVPVCSPKLSPVGRGRYLDG